jgi:hypothetical protein
MWGHSRPTSHLCSFQVSHSLQQMQVYGVVADCKVMSASLEELEDSLFEDTGFDEKVTRFASDSGCQVVYITKETFVDVDEDGKLL